MSFVHTIAAAAKPWADFYSHSKTTSSIVTWVHLAGVLVGGGFALASDRAAIRAAGADLDERTRVLRDFGTIHRPVLAGLTVVVLSGVMQTLSDAETFLVSKVYWTKMVLIVLLLANGYGVMRTEQRLALDPGPTNKLWGRFRLGALASITLWLATLLAGSFLMSS
jgi:hypothetical protein